MFHHVSIEVVALITKTSIASEFNTISNLHHLFIEFIFFSNYYYPADAYNKSKLAQVLFTKHMEVICKEQGLNIQSHAPHPGIVNTDLFENSSTTYIPWFKSIFYKVIVESLSISMLL